MARCGPAQINLAAQHFNSLCPVSLLAANLVDIGNAVCPDATKSPDYLWTACRAIQGWLMNKRASSDAEPRPMR